LSFVCIVSLRFYENPKKYAYLKLIHHNQRSQTRGPLEWPMRPVNIRKNKDFKRNIEQFGVNFINFLPVRFSYESLLSTFYLLRAWLWINFSTKYACVKCWWNWPLVYKKKFSISSIFSYFFMRPVNCTLWIWDHWFWF